MIDKRLNLILANGLHVLNAKFKRGTSTAVLFITDYTNNTRVIMDMENGKVLANNHNVELTKKDIEELRKMMKE